MRAAIDAVGRREPQTVSGRFIARRKQPGIGLRFHRWAKNHLLLYLTIWAPLFGFLTFLYKDILLPHTAPVNISLNLDLKKINVVATRTSSADKPIIPVEMQLSATNPSSREIHLLPNVWIAHGYRVTPSAPDVARFGARMNNALSHKRLRPAQRYAINSDGVALAGGILLADTRLKPDEKVVRKLVFHVPKDTYDVIEVWIGIPTTSRDGGLLTRWKFENNEMVLDIRYARDGRQLARDADNSFVEKRLELQNSTARVAMSLSE